MIPRKPCAEPPRRLVWKMGRSLVWDRLRPDDKDCGNIWSTVLLFYRHNVIIPQPGYSVLSAYFMNLVHSPLNIKAKVETKADNTILCCLFFQIVCNITTFKQVGYTPKSSTCHNVFKFALCRDFVPTNDMHAQACEVTTFATCLFVCFSAASIGLDLHLLLWAK